MKKVTIKIETTNAAFTDNPEEVARILKHAAQWFEAGHGHKGHKLLLNDYNGNTVGEVKVS